MILILNHYLNKFFQLTLKKYLFQLKSEINNVNWNKY